MNSFFTRLSDISDFSKAIFAPLLFFMGVAAEIYAAYYFTTGESVWVFLFFHLISSLAFFTYLCVNLSYFPFRNLVLFYSLFWLFAPMFGALNVMIMMLIKLENLTPNKTLLSELESAGEMGDKVFKELSMGVTDVIKVRSDDSRMSHYTDILESDDLNMKRLIIGRLRAAPNRDSVRLLRVAQKDKAYSIKYLTTLAINSIELDWREKIKQLEEQINLEPRSQRLRCEIVFSILNLHESGLLTSQQSKIYLKTAFEHAEYGLSLDRSSGEMLLLLGRVQLLLGKSNEARASFEAAIAINPGQLNLKGWLAEALYDLQEYDELKSLCEEIGDFIPEDSLLRSSVGYWSRYERTV